MVKVADLLSGYLSGVSGAIFRGLGSEPLEGMSGGSARERRGRSVRENWTET